MSLVQRSGHTQIYGVATPSHKEKISSEMIKQFEVLSWYSWVLVLCRKSLFAYHIITIIHREIMKQNKQKEKQSSNQPSTQDPIHLKQHNAASDSNSDADDPNDHADYCDCVA